MKMGEGKNYGEYIGRRYGRLFIEGYRLKQFRYQRATVFECRCDCGRVIETIVANVLSGYTTQCLPCSRATPKGRKLLFRGELRTVKEIAEMLGISRQAVNQRIVGDRVREVLR